MAARRPGGEPGTPRRPGPKKQRRALLPPWLVLLGGLLLGAASTLGWRWLDGVLPESPAKTAGEADLPEVGSTGDITLQTPTRFQFYTILPNQETLPPALPEPATPAPRGEPASPPAVEPVTSADPMYYLQAGTFRDPQEALRKKRQIAALRHAVRIQKVVLQERAWYRVLVGPFTEPSALGAARKRLQAVAIETVALQVRP